MTDPTDARSKAEASLRLAELAKTPRARELFRQLAEEYESRAKGEMQAEPGEQADAAPPLAPAMQLAPVEPPATAPLAPGAPLSESEQWIADLKAVREKT